MVKEHSLGQLIENLDLVYSHERKGRDWGMGYSYREELTRVLERIDEVGQLSEAVASKVLGLAVRGGSKLAMRFLWQSSSQLWKDDGFEVEEYADLLLQVADRTKGLGRFTSKIVALEYVDVLKQGVSGEVFVGEVEEAVRMGGKRFGGWFARGVAGSVEEKQDLSEYREALHKVYMADSKAGDGKRKLTQAFNGLAARVASSTGVSLAVLAEEMVEVQERCDRTIASWYLDGVCNLSQLEESEYGRVEFKGDLEVMGARFGKRAARAYGMGLVRVAGVKKEQGEWLADCEVEMGEHEVERYESLGEMYEIDWKERYEQAMQANGMMGLIDYRETFAGLVEKYGVATAVFYSFCMDELGRSEEEMVAWRQLPELIAELQGRLDEETLSLVLYKVPMFAYKMKGVVEALQRVLATYDQGDVKVPGPELVRRCLGYSVAASRRAGMKLGWYNPVEVEREWLAVKDAMVFDPSFVIDLSDKNGYRWVTDIVYDPEWKWQSNIYVLKYARRGAVFGVPSYAEEGELVSGCYGVYVPLSRLEPREMTREEWWEWHEKEEKRLGW